MDKFKHFKDKYYSVSLLTILHMKDSERFQQGSLTKKRVYRTMTGMSVFYFWGSQGDELHYCGNYNG